MGQRRRPARDRLAPMVGIDEPRAARLADALLFMRARIDNPPRLEEIAAVAGFSPFHFHRIFRAATGEGPSEFVVRHRLERAAFELRTTQQRVTQIGARCGYTTPSAFARAFTAKFGMSPSEFRKNATAAVPARQPSPSESAASFEAVRIETYEPQNLLGLRHVGPYSEVGPCWETIIAIAQRRDLIAESTGFLGLSYDDPAATGDERALRYDACITASSTLRVAGLKRIRLPGGKHAVLRHRGPYELIGHSFDWMISALVLSGRVEVRDAPFVEVYLNRAVAASRAELETDLAIPIH
jgi:AraC family transcriptional regulator